MEPVTVPIDSPPECACPDMKMSEVAILYITAPAGSGGRWRQASRARSPRTRSADFGAMSEMGSRCARTVLVLYDEIRTANRSRQLRLLPRELERAELLG